MVTLKKPWPALLHFFLQSLAGALGPSEACSMQRKMNKQSHSPTAFLLRCEHLLCNGCSKCQFLSWAGFVVFFQRWLPSLGISCLWFLLQMTTSNFPYLVTHKEAQYKTLLLNLPELMQTRATIIPNTRSCDGFQQSHLPSLCSISKCHGTVFMVFV